MDKLSIANEMRQFDLKNRNFYDDLTAEEKKKFSNYLMLRWGSAVEGNYMEQAVYVLSCNENLNKHFFDINRHPKLQWLCATTVSPGWGAKRHPWIAPKKKVASDSAKRKALRDIFPDYKEDEIDVMMTTWSQKDIDAYNKQAGKEK